MSSASSLTSKSAIVFGSCGALGRATVARLRAHGCGRVIGIDVGNENELCSDSITLNPRNPAREHLAQVLGYLQKTHTSPAQNNDKHQLHSFAILCLAGGWAGGNAGAEELLPNTEAMLASSLFPSLISASIAAQLGGGGAEDGGAAVESLLLPGAAPVLEKNHGAPPFMLPYSVAKAGVHQLVRSMASDAATAGLPENTKVFGIAPRTLDTEVLLMGFCLSLSMAQKK